MIIKRIYTVVVEKLEEGAPWAGPLLVLAKEAGRPSPTAPSTTRVCTQWAHSPTRLPLCLSPSLLTLIPKAREEAGWAGRGAGLPTRADAPFKMPARNSPGRLAFSGHGLCSSHFFAPSL